MSPQVRVVEPHPDTSNVRHVYTGRGGAGNSVSLRNTATTSGQSAFGPASRIPLNPRRTSFTSGRGGAGNVHSSAERAIFSFDEELESQLRREKQIAPVFHVGRGGAGNMIVEDDKRVSSGRKSSDARSTTSANSDSSAAEGAKERARRSLERGWERLTRVRTSSSRER